MSASSKKKLRKEQVAAELTQKQKAQQKEDRKLKAYTIAFVAVLAVIVITVVGVAVSGFVKTSGFQQKNTTAVQFGEHKLSSVNLSYYFQDVINSSYSQWSSAYGDQTASYLKLMGLDVSQPLNAQNYGDEGKTWADYFMDEAIERAKSDYALYDLATAEGFTLSEEDEQSLQSAVSMPEVYANAYGYKNANEFLTAQYGYGSDTKSYAEYCRINAVASAYYNAHMDSLTFDDAAIREYEKDNFNTYSSFTYNSYYVNCSNYLTGGTEAEDGTMTYTDEERAAAQEAAKKDADSLCAVNTVEALDNAIKALAVNAESTGAASTHSENARYTNLNTLFADWLADASRKEGDITVIADEHTSEGEDGEETTTVSGYYVVLFGSRSDNTDPMSNIRDITVAFAHADAESTETTFTDEEKATARSKADEIFKAWADGAKTEDSFDKAATDAGLFADTVENIAPDTSYTAALRSWAIDAARQPGEAEVIETEDGVHILYFIGRTEQSYRDYLITNDLRSKTMEEWYQGIIDPIQAEVLDLSKIRTDLILQSGS